MKLLKTAFFLSILLLLCLPVSEPLSSSSRINTFRSKIVLADFGTQFTLPDGVLGDVWNDADITDDDDTIDSIAKQVSFAGSVLFLFFLFLNIITTALTRSKRYAFSVKLPDAHSFLQVFRI